MEVLYRVTYYLAGGIHKVSISEFKVEGSTKTFFKLKNPGNEITFRLQKDLLNVIVPNNEFLTNPLIIQLRVYCVKTLLDHICNEILKEGVKEYIIKLEAIKAFTTSYEQTPSLVLDNESDARVKLSINTISKFK